MKERRRKLATITGLIVLGAMGQISLAQAQISLQATPGLTETQRPVAVAIDILCPPIAGTSNPNGTLPQRFAASCTTLKLNGLSPGTPFDNLDLKLTNDQLKAALERYGGKENVGSGQIPVNTPGNRAIQGRFFQLHQGARGFNLTKSIIDINGKSFSLAELNGMKGGAAGEDTSIGGKWGGFLNVNYAFGDKDTTSRETGFDFSSLSIAGGVDYRFSDNFVGGAAVAYSDNKSDFDLSLGDVKDRVYTVSLYATYYVKDAFYIDGHVGYGDHSFDTSRRIVLVSNNPPNPGINATATSDGVGGQQFNAFAGAGYNHQMGEMTLTPYANIAYLKLDVDAFSESEPVAGMALSVQKQSVSSLQTALGVRISRSISSGSGVFVPQAFAAYHHEFDNNSRSITARFVNDPAGTIFAIPTEDPDRNFFTVGAGVSAVFARGVSGFLNYETVLGMRDVSNHIVSAGLRMEW